MKIYVEILFKTEKSIQGRRTKLLEAAAATAKIPYTPLKTAAKDGDLYFIRRLL